MNTYKTVREVGVIRYSYAICAILILSIIFSFGWQLEMSSQGMIVFLLQGIFTYCAVKILNNTNVKSVSLTIGLATLCFIIVSVFSSPLHFSSNAFREFSISSIVYTLIYFIYALHFGLLAFIWVKFNKAQSSLLVVWLLIQIICVAMIDNKSMNIWMPDMVFYITLFLLQAFGAYCICQAFDKFDIRFLIYSNLFISVYFIAVRMYMLCFITNEVRNTGWALSYILSEMYKISVAHIGLALLACILGFIIQIRPIKLKQDNLV